MDVSRSVAEVAYLQDGVLQPGGKVLLRHPELDQFSARLGRGDHVVLEATGNTAAIVRALKPHAEQVIVANPLQVRLIAEARVKTDKIDAGILAQLYAAGFLPRVWMPDDQTEALRRQVSRRQQLVRQATRLKNQIHAVLAANLIESCPATDLFGKKGRAWLVSQPLPMDEKISITQRLRALDLLAQDLKELEQPLAQAALESTDARLLLSISGVNGTVAMSLLAAIGDISRFSSPGKLVSYLGLNPSVFQTGNQPARHGRITKRGRSQARGMLVEAAWSVAQNPGPLRAFYLRVRSRRGQQIAAVATARKLAVIVWHVLSTKEPYAWERPALSAHKLRQLQLASGMATQHGSRKGISAAYSLKAIRDAERTAAEQAERQYQRLFSRWEQMRPKDASSARWPKATAASVEGWTGR
ncbi:MAG: IS110 family transposase [Burkholderiaceae bacterium]